MLFHITHTHTWDACPYHDPERGMATFGKAFGGMSEAGVTLHGAWVDAPAHKVFFIMEADSAQQIEAALAPVVNVGSAETRPVVSFADILERRAMAE